MSQAFTCTYATSLSHLELVEDCFCSLLITHLSPKFFYTYNGKSYSLSFAESGPEGKFLYASHQATGISQQPWACLHLLRDCSADSSLLMLVQVCGANRSGKNIVEVCSLPCASSHRGPGLSLPLTWVLWRFPSPGTELSIHPCTRAYAWVSLDPTDKCTCKKWFSCFCPELPFSYCRQVNHLKQKPSLRRTRAWCGSCWSSCGLVWTCHRWCCPPSSWSHARSLTNSLITTTMLTCFPSKQHAVCPTWTFFLYLWICVTVLALCWLGRVCLLERLPNNTYITGFSVNQARHQLQWPFKDRLLQVRGNENG